MEIAINELWRSLARLRRARKTTRDVKDVQGIQGRTKADMQSIEEGVKQTLDAIYVELTAGPKLFAVS